MWLTDNFVGWILSLNKYYAPSSDQVIFLSTTLTAVYLNCTAHCDCIKAIRAGKKESAHHQTYGASLDARNRGERDQDGIVIISGINWGESECQGTRVSRSQEERAQIDCSTVRRIENDIDGDDDARGGKENSFYFQE